MRFPFRIKHCLPLLLGILLVSCSDDDEKEKEYRSVAATKEVQNITLTTADVPAYTSVSEVTMNTVDFEAGIQYTLATDANYEDAHKKAVAVYQPSFSVSLSGLTPQTSYICRAYVFAQGEYTYGQNVTFQTAKLQNVFSSEQLIDTKTHSATVRLKFDKNLLPTSASDLDFFTAGIAYSPNKQLLIPNEEAIKNASAVQIVSPTIVPKDELLQVTFANLKADATYFYCTYVCCNGIYLCGQVQALETPSGKGTIDGHDWVDLGLPSGTCWATTNVGASSPEKVGSYFAWGETSPKDSYTKETYTANFRDAASAAWGDAWQMPTQEQALELLDNCRWKYTKQNVTDGYLVTGPNNNSIFLPYTGYYEEANYSSAYSCYWTSTPSEENEVDAYYIGFRSNSYSLECDKRFIGQTVRPVLASE